MHQALDHQQILAADVGLMAEEDLEDAARAILLMEVILGLDELADHGDFECPHQIGHKDEAVLQQGEQMDGLAAVVIGNLAAHLAHPLLDLFGGDHCAQLRRPCGLIHAWLPPDWATRELPGPRERRPPDAIAPGWESRGPTQSPVRSLLPAKACARFRSASAPAAAP